MNTSIRLRCAVPTNIPRGETRSNSVRTTAVSTIAPSAAGLGRHVTSRQKHAMNLTHMMMPIAFDDLAQLASGAPQIYLQTPDWRSPAVRPAATPAAVSERTSRPGFTLPADEVEDCSVIPMALAFTTSEGNWSQCEKPQHTVRMVPSHRRYTMTCEMQQFVNDNCHEESEQCPASWMALATVSQFLADRIWPTQAAVQADAEDASSEDCDSSGICIVAAMAELAELSRSMAVAAGCIDAEIDSSGTSMLLDCDLTLPAFEAQTYSTVTDCFSELARLSTELLHFNDDPEPLSASV